MSMNTKMLGYAILIILVIGVAYWALTATSITPVSTTTSASSTTLDTTAASATSTASASYTLTVIALHNSATSCWTAINGTVYNLTNWISSHPGGPDKILSICGKDGSAAFNGQHSGQSQPASILATYAIGKLSS